MADEKQEKTIQVSLETWQDLNHIKIDDNAESLDDVIQALLKKAKK